MTEKKIVCYASSLGDCSEIQSKEHYISRGLWENKMITIQGVPWLKGETKTLSVDKVFRKILCTTHNNSLEQYDREGIKLFRTADRFHSNQHSRAKLKKSAIWKPDRAIINGPNLERLMAKIAVGILQEFPESKWYLTGSPAIEPPPEIIRAIYGLENFQYPQGLYFANVLNDVLLNENFVGVNTLFHNDSNGYIGAIISFRHWQFFINLSDMDSDNYSFLSASGAKLGKHGVAPIYRCKTFNFLAGNGKGGGKLSGRIDFDWQF